MEHMCYLCIVFVMLSRLCIAALWSPEVKGLTSWLLFVMFYCHFVTFPFGILRQVWYLIVSMPDHCSLLTLHNDCSHIEDLHLPFCAHLINIICYF